MAPRCCSPPRQFRRVYGSQGRCSMASVPEQFGAPFIRLRAGRVRRLLARNTPRFLERGQLGQQVVGTGIRKPIFVVAVNFVTFSCPDSVCTATHVDLDLAGSGPAQRAADLQQRRFAGAARPDRSKRLPLCRSTRSDSLLSTSSAPKLFVFIFCVFIMVLRYLLSGLFKRFHSAMTCAAPSRTSCTAGSRLPWRRAFPVAARRCRSARSFRRRAWSSVRP